MNIRPFHHLESTWLNAGTPGCGALCECDIDRACSAKKPVVIEQQHAEGADSMADWDWPQTHIVDRLEEDHDPIDAPAKHGRQRRTLGVALMTVGAVLATLCITAYLRAPT